MVLNYLTKLSGLKRGIKPKVVVFTSQSTSATKNDYTDEIATSEMLRGRGSTYGYAIPRDAINADLRQEGSSIGRFIGDEFASATESFIWLGADKNLLIGGGPLTENNGPTYVLETSDDESPLYEQTIGNLVSSSSQYWSLPTAAAVQVGTNSWRLAAAFKNSTLGAEQAIVFYGSKVTAKAYYTIQINSSNQLLCEVWDGTTAKTITDTIPGRWQDGRQHIVQVEFDTSAQLMILSCDGVFIGSVATGALNTLTIAGENFYIGAQKNSGATINRFFNGNISLVKLINNSVDRNVTQVWNMGIREAVSSGTYTIPVADTAKRLNNKFGTPNTDLSYFYSTLNLEDGEYEMQIVYEKGAANGKLDIIMDGNTIRSGLDTYNASTTHNNIDKTYGIKISGGRHLFVIKNNGKNASSSGNTVNLQWISLIKRRGHENGGVDNFLLLGDEIVQNVKNALTFTTTNSDFYNNVLFQTSTPANGDYLEGVIFVKGGLYQIDFSYSTESDAGMLDLWFGNVQVLSLLDEYNASVTHANVKTVLVRLNQGRQDVRLAVNGKNGSSSGFIMIMNSLRGVRLSD